MVLSNKKLKQKLRSLLAQQSISASESKKSHKESSESGINEELQSIKELLISKSRKKPKSGNPRKRIKKAPLVENPEDDEGSEETHNGNSEISLKEEVKKKKKEKKKEKDEQGIEGKKRKREEESDRELIEERKRKKREKRENRQKKQKKEKVQPEEEKFQKASEIVEKERNQKIVEEPVKIDESETQKLIKIDESETKKVYVGGIPYYSSEDDIRSFFEGCGTVTEMDCMTFPESGKFRGIAILTFKTEAAAIRALALDGADMGGFYLKIQPYKPQQRPQKPLKPEFTPKIVEGYNRIYAGNLSWDITEDDLKQLFSDCKVSSIRFGTDKETGDFKGYAHVDFEDHVSLTIALKLDQTVVCGRPVKISCAVPKKGVELDLEKKSEDVSNVGSSKKKRRTCYVCGVPGHLSSACPKKKKSEDVDEVAKKGVQIHLEEKYEDVSNVGSSKKKRRTCYVCGVPGHLSSVCPKKKKPEDVDGAGDES
ncbi:protein gar2-like isoform X2 [Asparagus officinalis]|uniref:protein gar2-like isoform X2 n=1 Tax=Asparagus officinalis TaxID=4686 RepID=UPI00098E1322|nr:protein gar2-like isoform X2 [Asparagus officinalis]